MKVATEVGILWANKTGSYNHNEIVVPVDLDAEVDENIELGFVEGALTTNHSEIVVSADLDSQADKSTETGAAEAGLHPRWGWSNHNEIVIAG
ncbi:hypothetical protein ACFVW1_15385 [Streptomyces olivochromogenes]|uniref:hypothetical protein n=1 Tax=Streptomyces olivochromogenes TaxID=1963 RepID=UPI0036D8D3A2